MREIFERYIAGASCRAIAAELNERGVVSPGAAWNRTVRRCGGWMASGVRAIVRNERYTGLIRWNTSEWRKDPDSGKRLRYERPRSDWLEHQDEAMRIVPNALFEAAARRTQDVANTDERLKSGLHDRTAAFAEQRCLRRVAINTDHLVAVFRQTCR